MSDETKTPRERLRDALAAMKGPLCNRDARVLERAAAAVLTEPDPAIPIRLPCPMCGELHIDEGEFATKVHHTHACQKCGHVWRPAVVATVGVRFLPGFKSATEVE